MALAPITPHIPDVDEFLSHCHRRRYPTKTTIIHAGDSSDTLYYIIKGAVTVIIEDDDGREMVVAYLNPGDFFGEMGLFGHQDRSAWVRTKTECEVGEISYGKFLELTNTLPQVLFALTRQLADRLRDTTRKVGDLAFLPAHSSTCATNRTP